MTDLLPHQQRVVHEKDGLDAKLDDLRKFIAENPVFATLDPIDQIHMQQQEAAMSLYSTALRLRIARFSV